MVDYTEFITYGVVFGFFFVFLKYLLYVARKDFNKDFPVMKEDLFLKEFGYSWDYVFVFVIYDEDEKDEMTQIQRDFTFKAVIDRVQGAGMETKCFYSVQRDEIYVKVRCNPERLKEEASRIDYKLLLDKNRLRVKAQAGKPGTWNPITIVDEYKQSPLSPYDYIYGVFINKSELQALYKQYDIGDKKYPFKQVDRIKLIISILQNKITDDPPGAGLNIGEMAAKRVTCGQFPIQNYEDLVRLQKRWLVLWSWPWNQPLEDIRDYFGERIGFYFLYLQHYVTSLIPMALLGLATLIYNLLIEEGGIAMYILDIFLACAMLVWSTLFIEYWKRLQSIKGMEWGMTGFEDSEQDRPLFIGIDTVSPVDGSRTRYFPSSTRNYRSNVVTAIVSVNITGVMAVVSGIFYFQYWAALDENSGYLTVNGTYFGNTLVSIVSALVISVLNFLYSMRALSLNEWQNHRTDTEFEDQLINKIFMFQLVNSYAALTYVSFFKHTLAGSCVDDDCLTEVKNTISTIFITALVTRMIQQVLVAMYNQAVKHAEESEGIEPGAVFSPLEEQYTKSAYDPVLVTLGDYAALVIQFGYTTLFVVAFPLGPTLAFLSGYIQIRMDGWKFCQAYQRPEPRPAEDIGVWQNMIEILSYLAVMYNFGMLFFTGDLLSGQGYSSVVQWIVFIIAQNVTIGIKVLIADMVEDVPEEVAMQLERQEFLCNKVIYDMKDDEEDTDTNFGGGAGANILIDGTDYDWILPDEDMPAGTEMVKPAADDSAVGEAKQA
jgi:hypothetical protein